MEALNVTVTVVRKPNVRNTFRTVFSEEGPPCLICGRRLNPFKRGNCPPVQVSGADYLHNQAPNK
jgi:hypothetical protein